MTVTSPSDEHMAKANKYCNQSKKNYRELYLSARMYGIHSYLCCKVDCIMYVLMCSNGIMGEHGFCKHQSVNIAIPILGTCISHHRYQIIVALDEYEVSRSGCINHFRYV